MQVTRRRGAAMRKWIYAAIATASGLGLIVGTVLVTGVVKLDHTATCSKIASRPGGGPLGDGKKTTVAEAQSSAGFPVLIPDVQEARLSNLSQTWINSQRHVAMTFAHGKVTMLLARAMYTNALKNFQRFIRQNHATAAISHVHRQPALVITPDTDACGSNPAWVEFEHNGIDINIYSHGYGTSTLLSIASSLKQHIPPDAEPG
jgi:hypothetical protein